jgi:hypothetical protein
MNPLPFIHHYIGRARVGDPNVGPSQSEEHASASERRTGSWGDVQGTRIGVSLFVEDLSLLSMRAVLVRSLKLAALRFLLVLLLLPPRARASCECLILLT